MRNKVVISNQGAPFIEKGQTWMYANNLVHIDKNAVNGDVVDIVYENGRYLATGFLNRDSHVIVRILTRQQDEKIDETFFMKRIKFAYDFRKCVERKNLTNCRYVFGEADGLPGLTVDRYNDILVTQITSYGLEMRKELLYGCLLKVFKQDDVEIKAIYERNDVKAREKEGLKLYKGFYGNHKLATTTIINENGLKLYVDIENGQKTGYFLDQKSNRLLLREMAYGKKVCDCFSHTGGFALNAALGGASEVTAVDVSKTALDEALENAKLNHLEDRMKFVQADVFDFLDTIKENQYDIIVLDPPAFTKNRRTIDHAYKGYLEINKKAMNVLRHGGYLISCSCSRFMEREMYEKMLRQAASETGVTLKQVSVTQQNHDHPILWGMAETSYLKFYIFQII
ncbi:MAG TPA: rRNA large subunit methyltransferase I [Erysipelotrichaceae bacterium]|nr:rRNA large subunit methyltransferase I [Erysipelotrichaceae bacterium]HBZ51810.1 rRNA large subunit methyltransferase I [Erysipelotrichaceae bacterium]